MKNRASLFQLIENNLSVITEAELQKQFFQLAEKNPQDFVKEMLKLPLVAKFIYNYQANYPNLSEEVKLYLYAQLQTKASIICSVVIGVKFGRSF